VFDMLGNVAELCQDWYGDYPDGAVADPLGAPEGKFRVIRGGGFCDRPSAGDRFSATPSYRLSHFGFRVVRELPGPGAGPRTVALIAATTEEYRDWLQRMQKTGYRPTFVSTHRLGKGDPCFVALAVRDGKEYPWEATVRLDPDEDQEAFNKLTARGYRPISAGGCLEEKVLRYDGLYVRDGERLWDNQVVDSIPAYTEALQKLAEEKLRPLEIRSFRIGKKRRIAILAERAGGVPHLVRIDMTDAEYQAFLAEGKSKGFRPLSVFAYPDAGEPRFAAVLLKDNPALEWMEKHDVPLEQMRRENDRLTTQGFRPVAILGYWSGNRVRYLGVWVKDALGGGG
jgi:hypothetical protein